jgi:hypothetical protein
MKTFVSEPIGVTSADIGAAYHRADLIFDDVDHSSTSFTLKIFFNNPDATDETSPTPENGYVGSVPVFGHGGCFGDEGHCEVPVTRRPFDLRPPHHLTPARMWIEVTDSLRGFAQQGETLTITVVHVVASITPQDKPLPFQRVSLVTYA